MTDTKRRVTTKVMCGWCAGSPVTKGMRGHRVCPGYDEATGKGCLCAAYDHKPHRKVVAHQARYNHLPEETIRAWWKSYMEGDVPSVEAEESPEAQRDQGA